MFFDIDGTIVSDDGGHIIPPDAVEAIRAARSRGHLMYINTGRTMMNIEKELIDIGFDGYICGCGTYVKCGDELLMHSTVEKSICDATAALIRECDMMPLYERYDTFFLDETLRESEKLRSLKEWYEINHTAVNTSIDTPDFSFDKFVAWFDEKSDIERFRREMDGGFSYIHRGDDFCEIVPKAYSKGTGIDMALEYEKIPRERAFAIGDSMNDLPMLEAVPNSIAMGGAVMLYDHVSFVTRNLDDGGIKFALEHFGMI